MKALIVEDKVQLADAIKEYLKIRKVDALTRYDGLSGYEEDKTGLYDVIILDLMLPQKDGLTIIKDLREEKIETPIIVLTAKASTEDKVECLLAGADDYMTKPFDMQELLARIDVQLRKQETAADKNVLRYSDISLDQDTHMVECNGSEIRLTRTEYAILRLLMLRPGQVVAKLTILEDISIDTPDCTEDSLKIHIHNLRRKLKAASGKDHISAVWGIGFMLTDAS
jgi:DNA-binding response OmpR family regulator